MTVYIEEEYGYRYWKAEVDMTEDALSDWWTTLSDISDLYICSFFPNAIQIDQETFEKSNVVWAHIHCNDDSYLVLSDNTNVFHNRLYNEYSEDMN